MGRKKKPLPDTVYTGEITALSHEGRGIIHRDHKTYFVENGLPGERVRFQVTRARRRVFDAKVVEWLQQSADRVQPRCAHANLCGGCSLQHLDNKKQIAMKQQTLQEQLQHFGGVQAEQMLTATVAEPWGYRRKARLGVKYVDKKGKLLLGFREKNSRYLADIEHCQVLHPRVDKLLAPLSALLASLSIMRRIPQVEVASTDDSLAFIIRHLDDFSLEDEQKLHDFAATHSIKLYLQPAGEDSIHRFYPPSSSNGTDLLTYAVSTPRQDLQLQFAPTDFIQVNAAINQKMITLLLQLLDLQQNETVLDLFSGVGNLSLPMATEAARVVGIEGEQRFSERAMANAKLNHLENTEFFAADLRLQHTDKPWMLADYDKCVLDPPRSGALEVIQQLANKKFSRLLYISCNPATLARDAGELVNKQGYRLRYAGVLDMFPHTAHVESIAVFE